MSEQQVHNMIKVRHRLSLLEVADRGEAPIDEMKRIFKLKRNSSIEGLAKKVENKKSELNKIIGLAFSRQKTRRSFNSQKQNKEPESNKENVCKGNSNSNSNSYVSTKQPKSPKSKFYRQGQEDLMSKLAILQMRLLEKQLQIIIDQPVRPLRSGLCRERFRFLQKLGQGSYSTVHLALDRESRSLFAVKMMRKQKMRDVQQMNRICSELKIQLFCCHPNIVRSYGTFHDQDSVYIIQEYAGRESLYSWIKSRNNRITLEQTACFIGQLCQAVGYLHSHSIIHRDLKPENVLIAPGGVVKLTDFGWSVYNPGNHLRSTFCGTPFYFSPELISSQLYDQSVDIWTIGVMTYQMLTGENPFGIKRFQDLKRIVYQQANFEKIKDCRARDFVSRLIKKQRLLRTSINDILDHPFLQFGRQCSYFE